jgi:hypothetical protein
MKLSPHESKLIFYTNMNSKFHDIYNEHRAQNEAHDEMRGLITCGHPDSAKQLMAAIDRIAKERADKC